MVTLAYLLLAAVNLLALVGLAAFTLRRIVYGVVALLPAKEAPPPRPAVFPEVLVLVPCRNEAQVAGRILSALAAQDYPSDRFRVVAIDDGSTDGTRAVLEEACRGRGNFAVLARSPEKGGRGKPAALNHALAAHPFGEIVSVFDADSVPAPDALSRVAARLADPGVAGVSGRMRAENPDDSVVAYYAYIEGLVHQMVTMRAADRLGGTTALLGTNTHVRRRVLEAAGGYREGARLEDTDLTLAAPRDLGRIVFDPSVECTVQVPATRAAYRQQHVGWQRGFAQALAAHWREIVADRSRPLWQRADALLFAMGYLDRLLLLGALVVAIASEFWPRFFFPWWLWVIVLGSPLAQVVLVLAAERAPLRHFLKLPCLLWMFPLDVACTVRATMESLAGRPVRWEPTPRRGPAPPMHDPDSAPALLRQTVAIILAYDDRAHLPACIQSLLAQGLRPEQVLLVDNGSADRPDEFVRTRWPGMQVVRSERNLGYAGGMNLGLRWAMDRGAAFALLVNTDAVAGRGMVAALLGEAGRPGVAAVGGLALSVDDPSRIDGAYGQINYSPVLSRLVGEFATMDARSRFLSGPRDVDYPYGFLWLVSMAAVREVGLLDEDYFCYHEELDWCFRARRAGYVCRFTPAAVGYHRRYRDDPRGEVFKRRMIARNAVLFLRKHGDKAHWLRFGLYALAALPVRLAKDLYRGRLDRFRAQIAGYVEGWRAPITAGVSSPKTEGPTAPGGGR